MVNVHHVHVWTLMSGRNVFSSHLYVRPFADQERVLDEVYDLLTEGFGFFFATVQVEERCRRGVAAAGDRHQCRRRRGREDAYAWCRLNWRDRAHVFGGADTATLRIPRSSLLISVCWYPDRTLASRNTGRSARTGMGSAFYQE